MFKFLYILASTDVVESLEVSFYFSFLINSCNFLSYDSVTIMTVALPLPTSRTFSHEPVLKLFKLQYSSCCDVPYSLLHNIIACPYLTDKTKFFIFRTYQFLLKGLNN